MLATAWTFLRSPLGRYLGIGLVVLGLVGGVLLKARSDGAASVKAQDRQAVAQAAATNQAAIAKSDVERAQDQAATASLQKDLTNAYAQTPDAAPSAARLALACQRLRLQAGPGAKLPVSCRPTSPAQAPARPLSPR